MSLMSAGRMVLSRNVPPNRTITEFPTAFHPDATPYHQTRFHQSVLDACSRDQTGSIEVKILKAVMVGDMAVGKSCLIERFCHDLFDPQHNPTLLDFEVEKFSILSVIFNLQIFDTAGQEKFHSISSSFYRGAHLVIVVFDFSKGETLDHCRRWKRDACQVDTDPVVFLVGAQKDKVSPYQYHHVEKKAIQLANEIGAEYWAVSSKTGDHVNEFFIRAVALMFDHFLRKELGESGQSDVVAKPIVLHKKRKSKPKCCK